MQKEFKELYQKYGLDNPNKTREDLCEDDERNYVNDCFDIYEQIGFASTYGTPYAGEEKYDGMKFTVLGRVKDIKDDDKGADLECLPMWNIRLENGETMAAYPEEICLAERKSISYTEFDNKCKHLGLLEVYKPTNKSQYERFLKVLQEKNIVCKGYIDDYNCLFEIRFR